MFGEDDGMFAAAGKGRGRDHGMRGHGGRSGYGGHGGQPGRPPGPPGAPHGRPPFFPWSALNLREFFSHRSRARRGDVRAAILVLLGEGPRNGYQLMQELEQRSRGVWRPSPGSVYPALAQLEDEGLVRSEASGPGKTYQLTDAGQDHVHEHAEELSSPYPWEHVTDEDEHAQREELASTMMQLAAAFRQVVHTGSPQQIEAARRLLDQTRGDLYRILAGDRAGGSPKERK